MNTITKSAFVRLGVPELKRLQPALVTAEEEVIGLWCDANQVISLADLHPRVRAQFRSLEGKVRLGMPPVEKVQAKDLQSVEV
jgi:hypothetical protein